MHLIDVYKSFDYGGFRILAGSKLKLCKLFAESPSLSVKAMNVIAQGYERLCFNGSLPVFSLKTFVDPVTSQPTSANLTITNYKGDIEYMMYDSVTKEPVTCMADYISSVYDTDDVPEYSI